MVAKEEVSSEVSRMFAAMLQLINNRWGWVACASNRLCVCECVCVRATGCLVDLRACVIVVVCMFVVVYVGLRGVNGL